MKSRPVLSAADARALIDAASAEAQQRGLEVSIAIVDAAGVPLTLVRLDGARLHTPEAAMLKARTAAIVRAPTAELQKQTAENPALLSFPGRMPLTGGMPLIHEGLVVGGIGSSGGEPADDEAVCAAALHVMAAMSVG